MSLTIDCPMADADSVTIGLMITLRRGTHVEEIQLRVPDAHRLKMAHFQVQLNTSRYLRSRCNRIR
jgi:hypothetical protein